jgi:hypothetical protein
MNGIALPSFSTLYQAEEVSPRAEFIRLAATLYFKLAEYA